MVVELREYKALPGQRQNWVDYMENVIIPFQRARGMTIVGSFTGSEDDETYIWIRTFASESERTRLYAAVYKTPEWENEISLRVAEMLDTDRVRVTLLEPTPGSGIGEPPGARRPGVDQTCRRRICGAATSSTSKSTSPSAAASPTANDELVASPRIPIGMAPSGVRPQSTSWTAPMRPR